MISFFRLPGPSCYIHIVVKERRTNKGWNNIQSPLSTTPHNLLYIRSTTYLSTSTPAAAVPDLSHESLSVIPGAAFLHHCGVTRNNYLDL